MLVITTLNLNICEELLPLTMLGSCASSGAIADSILESSNSHESVSVGRKFQNYKGSVTCVA
jgi:hypothetical protein